MNATPPGPEREPMTVAIRMWNTLVADPESFQCAVDQPPPRGGNRLEPFSYATARR